MTPAETEKALRDLFKKLRSPARAICHFPKPPQRHEVCGFSIYYKGALVREYYGKALLKEFKKTCREKDLWAEAWCCVSSADWLKAAAAAPSIALNIVYFVPDARKTGGSFAEVCGRIKKLVPHESLIIMEDGTRIKVEDVVAIELMTECS